MEKNQKSRNTKNTFNVCEESFNTERTKQNIHFHVYKIIIEFMKSGEGFALQVLFSCAYKLFGDILECFTDFIFTDFSIKCTIRHNT